MRWKGHDGLVLYRPLLIFFYKRICTLQKIIHELILISVDLLKTKFAFMSITILQTSLAFLSTPLLSRVT